MFSRALLTETAFLVIMSPARALAQDRTPPACQQPASSKVEFETLPERMILGREYTFKVADANYEGYDGLHVAMYMHRTIDLRLARGTAASA